MNFCHERLGGRVLMCSASRSACALWHLAPPPLSRWCSFFRVGYAHRRIPHLERGLLLVVAGLAVLVLLGPVPMGGMMGWGVACGLQRRPHPAPSGLPLPT